jgi:hypothetical protein
MADSSLMPALIGLSGTIIGSAIVLSTQLVLEGRKQVAEKRKKKAEKLEELVAALHEYVDWITQRKAEVISPLATLQAITCVYFPEFEKQIADLGHAGIAFANKGLMTGEISSELWNAFGQQVVSLNNGIRQYARREFQ